MINDLRLKIDDLDKKLLDLVIQRLELVREIGKIKIEKGISIVDKNRENEVLKRLMVLAEKKGIKPKIIKKIWKVLMEISYELEGGKNGNS